jgi:histidine triad (HIT) family protein
MMTSEDCLFCKIIEGAIPSKKVHDTENMFAFLDINPITEGHTVVVPKFHCVNLLDFPDDKLDAFFKDLKSVALLLKEKLGADGFNLLQNNGAAAGQVIYHAHYHIIPRKEGDNAFKFPPHMEVTPEQLDETLKKILN